MSQEEDYTTWIRLTDKLPNWGEVVEVRHAITGRRATLRLGYVQNVHGENVPVWVYSKHDMIAPAEYTHWRPLQET